jgi:hypothetical protein
VGFLFLRALVAANILTPDFHRAEEIAGTPPPPPVEEVLSPEDLVRPNVSWANLIVAAFQASGKQYLLVAQIYEQISRAHAFFRAQKNNNWKNAVRHALSVHSIFYRVNENEYKGGFWGYKPSDKPLKEKPSAAKKHEEVCLFICLSGLPRVSLLTGDSFAGFSHYAVSDQDRTRHRRGRSPISGEETRGDSRCSPADCSCRRGRSVSQCRGSRGRCRD